MVDGNTFAGNTRAVYLGGTSLAEVNRNSFDIGTRAYGLYLDASTAYGCEGNTFTGSGSGGSFPPEGIIVNASVTSSNRIYRNSFSGLGYGIKAQGTNGNTTNGLVFKCNDFDEDKYDIAVTSGAIKQNQGEDIALNLSAPAGNIFTDNLTTSTLQYAANTGVSSFTYNHHIDMDPSTAPFYAPFEYSSSIISLHECDVNYDPLLSCPISYADGGGLRMTSSSITAVIKSNKDFARSEDSDNTTDVGDYALVRNNKIRNFMCSEQKDSIIKIIANDTSLLANTLKTAILIDNGEYLEATAILGTIEDIGEAEAEGYNQDIYQIATQLKSDTLTWLDIDSVQLATLEINSNSTSSTIAKILLEDIQNSSYNEPIEFITNDEIDTTFERNILLTSSKGLILIYPNPILLSSMVAITLPPEIGSVYFTIYDLSGKIILRIPISENTLEFNLPVTLLSEHSIYFGLLTSNNTIIDSVKFLYIK